MISKARLEETFGMIKPEGIERKLVRNIEIRITDSGLFIVEKKRLIMIEYQFSMVYGHVKQNQPLIYDQLKEYMTTNPVIVLRVRGEEAVQRLSVLRGSSNPTEALPGTIRGDYAKDQDYNVLYKQRKIALNVFHASDSLEEANKMLKEFFGEIGK